MVTRLHHSPKTGKDEEYEDSKKNSSCASPNQRTILNAREAVELFSSPYALTERAFGRTHFAARDKHQRGQPESRRPQQLPQPIGGWEQALQIADIEALVEPQDGRIQRKPPRVRREEKEGTEEDRPK